MEQQSWKRRERPITPMTMRLVDGLRSTASLCRGYAGDGDDDSRNDRAWFIETAKFVRDQIPEGEVPDDERPPDGVAAREAVELACRRLEELAPYKFPVPVALWRFVFNGVAADLMAGAARMQEHYDRPRPSRPRAGTKG